MSLLVPQTLIIFAFTLLFSKKIYFCIIHNNIIKYNTLLPDYNCHIFQYMLFNNIKFYMHPYYIFSQQIKVDLSF